MPHPDPCRAVLMTTASPPTPQPRRLDRRGALVLTGIAAVMASCGLALGAAPASPASLASRVGQPGALALSADGGWLYVANRRSGSVSVVETRSARVVAEHDVGRGLADVVALAGGGYLLAVDQAGDALLLLEARGGEIEVADRLAVAAEPVTVAVAPDGGSCVVASLGARRLTFVGLTG